VPRENGGNHGGRGVSRPGTLPRKGHPPRRTIGGLEKPGPASSAVRLALGSWRMVAQPSAPGTTPRPARVHGVMKMVSGCATLALAHDRASGTSRKYIECISYPV
jgi:hypothetical protein